MNRCEFPSVVTATASAAAAALLIAYAVYRGQKLLARRQPIVPFWQYLSGLHEMDAVFVNPSDDFRPETVVDRSAETPGRG